MPPSSNSSESGGLRAVVEQTLTTHGMLAPGDRVLLGVSGGADSMALLHLFDRYADAWQIRFGVAHLNHGLRGTAADDDLAFAKSEAERRGRRFHPGLARVRRVQEGLGLCLEDAARRVRHAFLRKTMLAHGYNKLALGHHRDDNAEQVLLALIRGSGPRGLSGIPPVRSGHIIRPLIDLHRSQIEAYLLAEGIVWRRDATNTDARFLRNRIRHDLLPHLAKAYNPRIGDQLHRLATMMRSEEQWLDAIVEQHFDVARLQRDKASITLDIDYLRGCPLALTRRLLRRTIETLCGHLQRIGFGHIQQLCDLLGDPPGEKEIHLPGGLWARRCRRQLILRHDPHAGRRVVPGNQFPTTPFTQIREALPVCVESRALGIGLQLSCCPPDQVPPWNQVGLKRAYLDLDTLSWPLTLRAPQPGDHFTPLGAGGRQKLKKYFGDHRIPRDLRWQTPVLADKNRIVWLVGERIAEAVRLTDATRRVLSIEFFLLDRR